MTVGAILAIALALGFALRVSDDGGHLLAPGGRVLPDLCLSVVVFGVECPSCGLGRSVVRALDGDAGQSAVAHPGGVVLVGWVLSQLAARIVFALHRPRRRLAMIDLVQLPATFAIGAVVFLWLGSTR